MSQLTRGQVFSLLRAQDIVKVVVSFSGGNDEGGADGFTATKSDGTTFEMPAHFAFQQYNPTGEDTWVVYDQRQTRPATEAELATARLTEALEAPVDAEYGSFAGEFYVSGTVTWDVLAGTVKMAKNEQVYQDHYEEYDI